MPSNIADKAKEIGLDAKFGLLEKIIKVFSQAKKDRELDKWVFQVRQDILVKRIGCSEDVADRYIEAALNRI